MNDAWTRYEQLNELAHKAFLVASDALGTPRFPELMQAYYDTLALASQVRSEIRASVQKRAKTVEEITDRHRRLKEPAN